ncbi:MAG: hypothetical protein ABI678_15000 [Kofleriaceae bacterium]
MNAFKLAPFLGTLFACGGGANTDLDLASRDPRCLSACPESMPEHAGVGAVCDTASRAQCLDECEARIAGLPTVCQNCLVEDACFGPDGCFGSDSGGFCDETSCTLESEFGTCTYAVSDQAARLACLQKVDPRREVSCPAEFRSATKCETVCP